jgi:hypothetical protein
MQDASPGGDMPPSKEAENTIKTRKLMPHTLKPVRRIATVSLALGLAALALAACGSSSSKTTSSTNAAAASANPQSTQPGHGRFSALRECLQKQGITVPKRKPGGGAGIFGGGSGAQLPKGVTREQFLAAIKKCGGGSPPRRAPRAFGPTNLKTPAVRAALTSFAACMRQHGVNVPPPNTSGKGPVFNTSGLNVAGTQFHAAQVACFPELRSALGVRPGGASGSPPQAP